MRPQTDLVARFPVVLFLALVAALAIAYEVVGIRRVRIFRTELDLWQDALEHQPNDPMVHNGLGVAMLALGQSQQALAHFERAVQIDPRFVIARIHLGALYQQLGRSPEAIEAFQEALRIGPETADVHQQLALLLMQSGQVSEAIEHYRKALAIKPNVPQTWANLAIALEQTGNKPEAVRAAEKALELAHAQRRAGTTERIESWLRERRSAKQMMNEE